MSVGGGAEGRVSDESVGRRLRIFLNYRREETADAAGRLFDALVAHFGEGHVFMDIDAIEPGVDFEEVVNQAVDSCDVLIAVIGRQWLTLTDARGRRRLDNPDDYVRMEVQAALDRNVRVIPVLVQGAEMPSSDELPPPLKSLARRNAVELSPTRWRYDIGRLANALERIAETGAPYTAREIAEPAPATGGRPGAHGDSGDATPGPAPSQPARSRNPLPLILLGVIALVGVAVGALAAGGVFSSKGSTNTVTSTAVQTSSTGAPGGSSSASTSASGAGSNAGLKSCDANVSANSNTSCPFAENVFKAYAADYKSKGQQNDDVVSAFSPVTNQTYSMDCTTDGVTVNCSGGNNAFVTFPLHAVQVY